VTGVQFAVDCGIWMVRFFGLAVGAWTIYEVYTRSTPRGAIRRNAGRISGAIVLWWMAVLLSATAKTNLLMIGASRIVINGAGLAFCLGIHSVANGEKKLMQ
jgi:hypothetical protein